MTKQNRLSDYEAHVIGFAILFLAAAPILASAAVGLAQWLTL